MNENKFITLHVNGEAIAFNVNHIQVVRNQLVETIGYKYHNCYPVDEKFPEIIQRIEDVNI